MKLKTAWPLIVDSFNHWSNHRASRMGAALSYYTIFSIVPLITLFILLIGPILSQDYIQNAIAAGAQTIIGGQAAAVVRSMIVSIDSSNADAITIVVSIVILVFGTYSLFYELKNDMDDLWEVRQPKSDWSWKSFFSGRLLSLTMIPVLGFLFIISLVFTSLLSFVDSHALFVQIGTLLFSFVLMTFLFGYIYRYLPRRRLPWKEILRGAVITALLFMLGKWIINFYIAKFAVTSVFGAAGAFAVLLIWIYYSAEIFLFGASITYVYSKKYGTLKHSVLGVI